MTDLWGALTSAIALEKLREEIAAAAGDGLEDFANAVLEVAKRNVGVGDPAEDPDPLVSLAASGRVERHGPGVAVVVFETAYAVKQHEAQHFEHPRGGGAKYLERALTELAPRFEHFVAERVSAETKRGTDTGRRVR